VCLRKAEFAGSSFDSATNGAILASVKANRVSTQVQLLEGGVLTTSMSEFRHESLCSGSNSPLETESRSELLRPWQPRGRRTT